ncbi:hypothetical protein GA0061102_107911 [Rhizobium miluonense]|uniref:Uncharacterized protein n=1 Tax=Rhizobium miluonense TaxID=411945 RepID=A0A1C3XCB5_9HYPH|nr:hypothetical protein GA0061102_107911 [Rhizobium miluonense]
MCMLLLVIFGLMIASILAILVIKPFTAISAMKPTGGGRHAKHDDRVHALKPHLG